MNFIENPTSCLGEYNWNVCKMLAILCQPHSDPDYGRIYNRPWADEEIEELFFNIAPNFKNLILIL